MIPLFMGKKSLGVVAILGTLVPLAAFLGVRASSLQAAPGKPYLIQTNTGGDNVHLVDVATNKVAAVIEGLEAVHGVAVAPDGSTLYFSNEADDTMDVVDVQTLKITKKVHLSGGPNNITIGKDGRFVYVGIASCAFHAS